jgi:hypothetical protein
MGYRKAAQKQTERRKQDWFLKSLEIFCVSEHALAAYGAATLCCRSPPLAAGTRSSPFSHEAPRARQVLEPHLRIALRTVKIHQCHPPAPVVGDAIRSLRWPAKTPAAGLFDALQLCPLVVWSIYLSAWNRRAWGLTRRCTRRPSRKPLSQWTAPCPASHPPRACLFASSPRYPPPARCRSRPLACTPNNQTSAWDASERGCKCWRGRYQKSSGTGLMSATALRHMEPTGVVADWERPSQHSVNPFDTCMNACKSTGSLRG